MYAKGSAVSKDDSEAVKWFRKAAMHNDPAAQTNLGVMYLMGQGVPEDKAEGLKWVHKARIIKAVCRSPI